MVRAGHMKMKDHTLLFLSLEMPVGTGPEQANEGAGHSLMFRGKQIQKSNKGTEWWVGCWRGY